MWQRRLKLGTYFRIGVYVHWSFGLLVAYVGYTGYQDGIAGTLFGIALLLGMFFCVTLHEYGHALTARRFGIETLDITLFPIGGVARLMKIPRIPWQELLVAVAGPAVNIVILFTIGMILLFVPGIGMPDRGAILTEQGQEQIFLAIDSPSLLGYLLFIMIVNTALVLFNMIPAFPMDGGRVLRSILAMGLEYRRATRIASWVGVACALAMFSLAMYNGRPMPGLIAIFIGYAGLSEARQVDMIEPLRNLTVKDVMDQQPPSLSMDMPLGDLVETMRLSPQPAVPVVGPEGIVTGILMLEDVATAIRAGADSFTTVGMIARHDAPILSADESLETIAMRPLEGGRQFAVADTQGRLVGLLDLNTLRLRAEMVV